MNTDISITTFLNRISNHLIINTLLLKNIGLYHGKMGIAIFFYHYSRYSNNSLFSDFANLLIDNIIEEIHNKMYYDLEDGLCGIGWGIEYLISNGFIEGDSSEILFDIDQMIMERDILRVTDFSIMTGLGGIFTYYSYRVQNQGACEKQNQIFDKSYNKVLVKVYEAYLYNENCNKYKSSSVVNNCFSFDATRFFRDLVVDNDASVEKILSLPLGLSKGCAGLGLKLMGL